MSETSSFTINHNKLLRGIYVSRQDVFGSEVITIFDVHVKELNCESVLHIGTLYTIEHLAATYLRNDAQQKDKIVYWGSMGRLTGNYLIIYGDLKSSDIVDLMIYIFSFIANYEGEIPGVQPKDCGNCLLHDLSMTKLESCKLLEEVLLNIEDKNFVYPEQSLTTL